jgi:hypothetical protein
MGIPQGSILGPVLFLLFINDLPNCITKCECNLFADATILYTQSSSLDEAESQLQNDIDNLMTWLDVNRLHVNASKSSCMVLSTRHNVGDINITINDDSINVDNDVKYLGVYVSNDLSWDKHISNVCRKLGHGLQILRRLQGIVPVNDMVTIYKTIIQPHIDYCITIWGYAPKCQLKRVQRLQNKIFRLITDDYSWDTSPRDILSKFNIPSISQRRDYFNGINVFRCFNGSFPAYM